MLRRSSGTLLRRRVPRLRPATRMRPVVGHELLEHQLDERRLARAGGAHQEHELALADVAGEVLEADHVRVVDLGDVFEDDHGISSPLSAVNGQATIMRARFTRPQPAPSVLVHEDGVRTSRARPTNRGRRELRRTSGASQGALVWPATPGKGSPRGRGVPAAGARGGLAGKKGANRGVSKAWRVNAKRGGWPCGDSTTQDVACHVGRSSTAAGEPGLGELP